MNFRVANCLSIAFLGIVSSASAQNSDYFLPRSSNWDNRYVYPSQPNVTDGASLRGHGPYDSWNTRYSDLRPASYTYPASFSPATYAPPAYAASTYAAPVCSSPACSASAYTAQSYSRCAPAPTAVPYPSAGVGYPNNSLYVGYGLFGQPRAFARDEPVRNFFRFLLP